jgi:hypothetical protein
MTRHCGTDAGEPLSGLGWTSEDAAVLTIVRQYCSSFAMPDRQGWIAAIAASLEAFGDDLGPEVAVATLAVMQVMRRTRRSVFQFNAADCPHCASCVTPHERLLIAALRALRRGQGDAALAHATLLCEGNDARLLIRNLQGLADRCLPRLQGRASVLAGQNPAKQAIAGRS